MPYRSSYSNYLYTHIQSSPPSISVHCCKKDRHRQRLSLIFLVNACNKYTCVVPCHLTKPSKLNRSFFPDTIAQWEAFGDTSFRCRNETRTSDLLLTTQALRHKSHRTTNMTTNISSNFKFFHDDITAVFQLTIFI